jgi:hypothetical protein
VTLAVALGALAVALAALGLVGAMGAAALKRADRSADDRESRAIAEGKRDEAVAALDTAIDELADANTRLEALEGIAHASGVLVAGTGRVGVLPALRRARDRAAAGGVAARDPGAAVVPDAAPAAAPD